MYVLLLGCCCLKYFHCNNIYIVSGLCVCISFVSILSNIVVWYCKIKFLHNRCINVRYISPHLEINTVVQMKTALKRQLKHFCLFFNAIDLFPDISFIIWMICVYLTWVYVSLWNDGLPGINFRQGDAVLKLLLVESKTSLSPEIHTAARCKAWSEVIDDLLFSFSTISKLSHACAGVGSCFGKGMHKWDCLKKMNRYW